VTKTLLIVLAHPDDEIGCAATIAAHSASGHRVVLVFLTHGEMTESLGPLTAEQVAAQREAHAQESGRILGCEIRFLNFGDTRIEYTPAANYDVAKVIAEVKPDAVITWGEGWIRGIRHPDHQTTGEIVRSAVTLSRIARVVSPHAPHRSAAPVFALRDQHSPLPPVAIDVSAFVQKALELGSFYRERVGWPPEDWHRERLERAGKQWGVAAAEVFDAYESETGLYSMLFDSPVLPPF
jgi:LmbE family N-acetylglucosaminyl deacetylase